MEIDSVVLRRSPVLLLIKMMLITSLLYAGFVIYSFFLYQNSGGVAGLEFFLGKMRFFTLGFSIETFVVLILFLSWLSDIYEIKDFELIVKTGFIWRRQDIHSLKNIQSVYAKQGPLGTLFGFGTITLHNPLSKEEVILKFVPDPEKYTQAIKRNLDRIENQPRIVPMNLKTMQ